MFNACSRLRTFSYFFTQIERMISVSLQPANFFQGRLPEAFPIFLFRLCPCYFCQCQQAGINHVFHMFGSRYIFRPYVCLYPLYISGLLLCQYFRYRIVRVYLLQSQIASDSFGLTGRVVLVSVQITKFSRSHYHIVRCTGSSNSSLFSTP